MKCRVVLSPSTLTHDTDRFRHGSTSTRNKRPQHMPCLAENGDFSDEFSGQPVFPQNYSITACSGKSVQRALVVASGSISAWLINEHRPKILVSAVLTE